MPERDWVGGVNTDRPNSARMYDYGIGGKNNFPADRAAADALFASSPYARPGMVENRHFLRRVVTFLTGAGIRQFLDIGAGLPTHGNVHEVAQGLEPSAKVVYVDDDPIVLTHARALMAGSDKVRIVEGDARDAEQILTDPVVQNFIDWDQPTALLMIGLLHFIKDDGQPHDIVARFRAAMAPGSYLAISHGSPHSSAREYVKTANAIYSQATAAPVFRTLEEISRFFNGFEVLPPGVVYLPQWRPDDITEGMPPQDIGVYGGVGLLLSNDRT